MCPLLSCLLKRGCQTSWVSRRRPGCLSTSRVESAPSRESANPRDSLPRHAKTVVEGFDFPLLAYRVRTEIWTFSAAGPCSYIARAGPTASRNAYHASAVHIPFKLQHYFAPQSLGRIDTGRTCLRWKRCMFSVYLIETRMRNITHSRRSVV